MECIDSNNFYFLLFNFYFPLPMTISQLYQIYLQYPSVQTDTRKLKQGDLFFALKGDQFNGNKFAQAALDAGAAYATIDEPEYFAGERTILVEDTLATLQQLALHHRRQDQKFQATS